MKKKKNIKDVRAYKMMITISINEKSYIDKIAKKYKMSKPNLILEALRYYDLTKGMKENEMFKDEKP